MSQIDRLISQLETADAALARQYVAATPAKQREIYERRQEIENQLATLYSQKYK